MAAIQLQCTLPRQLAYTGPFTPATTSLHQHHDKDADLKDNCEIRGPNLNPLNDRADDLALRWTSAPYSTLAEDELLLKRTFRIKRILVLERSWREARAGGFELES